MLHFLHPYVHSNPQFQLPLFFNLFNIVVIASAAVLGGVFYFKDCLMLSFHLVARETSSFHAYCILFFFFS